MSGYFQQQTKYHEKNIKLSKMGESRKTARNLMSDQIVLADVTKFCNCDQEHQHHLTWNRLRPGANTVEEFEVLTQVLHFGKIQTDF